MAVELASLEKQPKKETDSGSESQPISVKVGDFSKISLTLLEFF